MKTFTLDTNCVIAVDENRAEAGAVLALSNAHARGDASVALVAISASERQQTGQHLESFDEFLRRINALGLGHLDLLRPMAYFDVTFFDNCLFSDDAMLKQEEAIHKALFPGLQFQWEDFCAANGLDVNELGPQGKKWRNAKCDVQALWSHVQAARDIFVTSDKNFHAPAKLAQLHSLFGVQVRTPAAAAALVKC